MLLSFEVFHFKNGIKAVKKHFFKALWSDFSMVPRAHWSRLWIGNPWKLLWVWLGMGVIIEAECRGRVQSITVDLSVIVVFSSPPSPCWLQGSRKAAIRWWLYMCVRQKKLKSLLYISEAAVCINVRKTRVCMCLTDMRTKQASLLFHIIIIMSAV